MSKHNVTVSGGTNETKYSLSGSYTGQNGVIINSDYEKFQGRASLTQQLYKNLSLKLNMSYTEDKRTGQTSSASLDSSTGYSTYLMYRAWAFRPIVLQNYAYDDETDEEEGEEDLEYAALFDGTVLNPIVSNDNESKTYTRTTFLTNAQLDWSITRNLKVRVLAGINRRGYIAENFYNSLTYNGRKRASNSDGVNSDVRWTNLRNWVNENTITYSKSIGTLHKYDLLGGFTMQGANTTSYGFKTIQIPNENMGMPGMDDGVPQKPVATYKEDALISYLARANYSYKQRYLFTASFRADGSSKFSKSNRWGYFPSGAFAWRFNEERFMMGLPFVDDAKLRVSWGMTGNNRIPENARYPYLTMSDWYSFNNNTPEAAYGLSGLGNDDLRWETTEQTNLGLDLSLLRSRINVTADVYRKTTHDLLLNADIPSTSGVVSVYKNIGRVRNDGLEFSLSTVNVRTKTFQWRSDFNIAFNRSKVLELADSQEYMTSSVTWTGNFNSTPLYITQVGGPLTAFYGFIWEGNYQLDEFNISDSGDYVLKDGIPDNGNDRSEIQPGHIKFRDVTGDGQITDADRVVIGRAEPLHTGGFNNVFRYRNIELTVFMQWSYGQHVMNANRIMFEGNQSGRAVNQFASYADRYDVNDPSTYNSENYAVKGGGPLGFYSSKTLEDASYLRLKTVQLSYDFPKSFTSRLRISGMQIYVSGQNLAVISGYTGLDPEVSTRNTALTPGFDYSSYARNRIYTGGIKITF